MRIIAYMVNDILAAVLSRGTSCTVVLEIPYDLVAVLAPFLADASKSVTSVGLDELPRMCKAPVDCAGHSGPWEGLHEKDISFLADLDQSHALAMVGAL